MRRRPRLLAGKSRRRTPGAMPGTAQMHSIVQDLGGVEPVLIDRRDAELRPPVQLPALPSAGCSLPPLRSRQPLLLQRVKRERAPRGAASCRAERYQDSLPGRRKHAERQRRYRTRQRCEAPKDGGCGRKVTHHPLTRERRRPVVPRRPGTRRGTRPFGDEEPPGVFRCSICGRFCAVFVHPGVDRRGVWTPIGAVTY